MKKFRTLPTEFVPTHGNHHRFTDDNGNLYVCTIEGLSWMLGYRRPSDDIRTIKNISTSLRKSLIYANDHAAEDQLTNARKTLGHLREIIDLLFLAVIHNIPQEMIESCVHNERKKLSLSDNTNLSSVRAIHTGLEAALELNEIRERKITDSVIKSLNLAVRPKKVEVVAEAKTEGPISPVK